MAKNRVLTIKLKKLGFWTDIINEEDITETVNTIPYRYLDKGEKVTLLEEKFYYRVPWSDKPYYKVKHHVYGEGYILAEAF